MKGTADDLAGAIGNTKLIRLRRASEETGCTILGKAEFMNPGGPVKDRAGLAILEDAERLGVLAPGGTDQQIASEVARWIGPKSPRPLAPQLIGRHRRQFSQLPGQAAHVRPRQRCDIAWLPRVDPA